MAKKPESGLRDPFNKWGAGDAAALTRSLTGPAIEAQKEITDLRRQVTGSVTMPPKEKAQLLGQLAQRSKSMKDLAADAKKSGKALSDSQKTQEQILAALTAVKRQLKDKDTDKDDKAKLKELLKNFEELYARDGVVSKKDLDDMEDRIEKLPEEVRDQFTKFRKEAGKALDEKRFTAEEKALRKILDAQEDAEEFFREQRKAIKNIASGIGMAVADRMGIGRFNVGNALRFGKKHIWGSYNKREGRREGSTFMDTRNYIQDWRKHRKVLNSVEGGSVKSAPISTDGIDLDELGANSSIIPATASPASLSNMVDQEEPAGGNWRERFTEYVNDAQEFHKDLLEQAKKSAANSEKFASESEGIGSSISKVLGFLGAGSLVMNIASAFSTAIKGFITDIPNVLSRAFPSIFRLATGALGAAGVVAGAAAGLAYAGSKEKEAIEANPNAPQYKDNAYAKTLRGEASSVAQGGEQNRQSALKVLQPGTAKDYLDAGPGPDGLYPDGYTKDQLVAMSKGQKVDLTPKSSAKPATISKGSDFSSSSSTSTSSTTTVGTVSSGSAVSTALSTDPKGDASVTPGKAASILGAADAATSANAESAAAEYTSAGGASTVSTAAPDSGSQIATGTATPEAAAISAAEPRGMPDTPAPTQAGSPAQSGGGSMQPATRMGVQDIPLFDITAGDMLAVNLGVLA